jgi:hypothetical protein
MTVDATTGDDEPDERPSRVVSVLDWLVRAEGVTALAVLLTAPALALGAALHSASNQRPLLALGLSVVAVQLLGIVAVAVLVRRLGDRLGPASEREPLAEESVTHRHRMESIDVSYRIDPADPRRHTMTSRETVVAERDGLTHVSSGVFWTGAGRQEIPSISGDPDVKMYIGDPDHPLEDFKIFFGGDDDGGLTAGEARSYEVTAELYDEEGTFRPFLYQVIRVPTGRLELVVALPHEAFPTVLAQVREPGEQSARPLADGLTIRPELGIATLSVEHPVVGAEYSIQWFPQGHDPAPAKPAEGVRDGGPAELGRA